VPVMCVNSGSEIEAVMSWYPQSVNAGDTHRGHLRRGRVLIACGVEFSPLRTLTTRGSALPGEPSDPEQICPECYGRPEHRD
jgi:hypothetical protein